MTKKFGDPWSILYYFPEDADDFEIADKLITHPGQMIGNFYILNRQYTNKYQVHLVL